MAVSVTGTESPTIGPPRVVVDRSGVRALQVLPDDSFIGLQDRQDAGTVTEVNLVVNWFEELKRLAPVPGK